MVEFYLVMKLINSYKTVNFHEKIRLLNVAYITPHLIVINFTISGSIPKVPKLSIFLSPFQTQSKLWDILDMSLSISSCIKCLR